MRTKCSFLRMNKQAPWLWGAANWKCYKCEEKSDADAVESSQG